MMNLTYDNFIWHQFCTNQKYILYQNKISFYQFSQPIMQMGEKYMVILWITIENDLCKYLTRSSIFNMGFMCCHARDNLIKIITAANWKNK